MYTYRYRSETISPAQYEFSSFIYPSAFELFDINPDPWGLTPIEFPALPLLALRLLFFFVLTSEAEIGRIEFNAEKKPANHKGHTYIITYDFTVYHIVIYIHVLFF